MSMSTSVCLSVYLSVCPQAYLHSHTRDLYQIFVDVAYGRGSVLRRQVDEIPKGRGNFWGFSSPLTMHCNAFAANNVMQQKGSFLRVMGVPSTGEA